MRAAQIASLMVLISAGSLAQSPSMPNAEAEAQAQAAFEGVADSPGSGPYPALKEETALLPNHVIYRPAALSSFGPRSLGVMVWGNGGCAADGAASRLHLEEIASHGYIAIANGKILTGPGSPPHSPPVAAAAGVPGSAGFKPPPPATQSADMVAALDWVLAENNRAGSPYFQRINPAWLAASGWSCGGLQALQMASDRRLKTLIIHSSGIFISGNPLPGIRISKEDLRNIHMPVIYILGGPSDIAYQNGMDDFKRISGVPAVVANLPVGHGGTFREPNGGAEASVVVSWLAWQLKGDSLAARQFTGPDCLLCKDPQWTIQTKNLSAKP